MDEGRAGPILNMQYSLPLYVVDIRPNWAHPESGDSLQYERCGEAPLGADKFVPETEDARYCFNCGQPDHIISSCPYPKNHALISLSRQYFNFFKNSTAGGFQRIHEVEESKRQRVRWLEEFEPGQVRGELLRDALGLREDDVGERVEWLPNMAYWGYPRGWVGPVDPRERVWKLITGNTDEEGDEDEIQELIIVGDEDDEERIVLPTMTDLPSWSSALENQNVTPDDSSSSNSSTSGTPPLAQDPNQRWAEYPNTYFLWSRLPVYSGQSLPALDHDLTLVSFSSTFDSNRQALWDSLTSQSPFSYSTHAVPPPPSTTPPPLPDSNPLYLPPPPPMTPPPLPVAWNSTPLPLRIRSGTFRNTQNDGGNDDEADMDLSD